MQAIAVNGRAYNNLTALAPGVVAGTVNGLRVNQNTLQIDGITSVDTGNNGNGVTLSVDAVQEVRVLTTSYQAEYGRSAGAQISAVTKSGTQQFRGSVYADRRKDDLNANTWLNDAARPAEAEDQPVGPGLHDWRPGRAAEQRLEVLLLPQPGIAAGADRQQRDARPRPDRRWSGTATSRRRSTMPDGSTT